MNSENVCVCMCVCACVCVCMFFFTKVGHVTWSHWETGPNASFCFRPLPLPRPLLTSGPKQLISWPLAHDKLLQEILCKFCGSIWKLRAFLQYTTPTVTPPFRQLLGHKHTPSHTHTHTHTLELHAKFQAPLPLFCRLIDRQSDL